MWRSRIKLNELKSRACKVGSSPECDFVIPEADPHHFTIRWLEEDGGYEIVDADGPSKTVVDHYELDETRVPPFALPVYISNDFHSPAFLCGFDPSVPDIWIVDSGGAEIQLKQVTKTFRRHRHINGIEGVNANILPGEFVGIYGPSGAGKTTLIEMLLGLSAPDRGSVLVNGHPPKPGGARSAYLPQSLPLPPELTGMELCRMAAANRGTSIASKISSTSLLDHILHVSGLDLALMKTRVRELSGGQCRRLALALALCKPDLELLIADEPTTGLDPRTERRVLAALRRVSRSGVTVVIVTHSASVCAFFDRVLILRKPDDRRAAQLSYNGLWHHSSLEGIPSLAERKTDIDKIAWLMSAESVAASPEAIQMEARWAPWRGKTRSVGSPAISFQWLHWFVNISRMQFREPGALLMISALSFACILVLQAAFDKDAVINLTVMLSVAAPWLAATYAATVTANLLRFYAFESFSGAGVRSYLIGLFLALVAPVSAIGLIFACGMTWEISTENLMHRALAPEKEANGVVTSLQQITIRIIQGFMPAVAPSSGGDSGLIYSPLQTLFTRKGRDAFPGKAGDFWVEDCKKIAKQGHSFGSGSGKADSSTSDDPLRVGGPEYFSQLEARMVAGFILLTIAGSVIGITAAAVFKKERVAVIACVVIFVGFLTFSRASIGDHAYMAPLAQTPAFINDKGEDKLGSENAAKIVPILLSYLSLGRYGFNILLYHPEDPTYYAIECSPMVAGAILAFWLSSQRLGSTKRIWNLLTKVRS